MSIYRAQEDVDFGSFKKVKDRDTRRPPSNVPYVVDNLWEWARPEAYPNRRKSKFASPEPEQALRSADLLEDCLTAAGRSGEDPESDGLPEECLKNVFRVEFVGDPVIAQLPGVEDAKEHPDCRKLRKLLIDRLDEKGKKFSWPSLSLEEKRNAKASQLFYPCLTSDQVDHLFDTAEELQPYKDDIRREITYWDDLELIGPEELADAEEGEILFEFRDYNGKVGYRPRPVGTGH